MEAIVFFGSLFVVAAWRLWVAIDRADQPKRRSYPQRQAIRGDLVPPQRDHPCYGPGEWEREQRDYGIGREAAADIEEQLQRESGSIFTRLRAQDAQNEARLAELIRNYEHHPDPDWDAWQRDPDPVAVPAGHPAPIPQAAPKTSYKMPAHDAHAWGRDVNQRGKEAENKYCRENGLPEVWR